MKTIIIFLMMCSVCFAYEKPDIISTKILTEAEQVQVKQALHADRNLVFKHLMPAKNDYENDFDRGTVLYDSKTRNYSFHKVIIPDGTTVRNTNFYQRLPDTEAITGKNLTFIRCNLVNVKIDPTWTIQDCNNCQVKREILSQTVLGDKNTKLIISHKVEQDGKFVEVTQDEEIYSDSELANALLRYSTE